jgi:hypothetical protein
MSHDEEPIMGRRLKSWPRRRRKDRAARQAKGYKAACQHLRNAAKRHPPAKRKERDKSGFSHTLARIGFESYPDYLASGLWKGIRTRVLTRSNTCIRCRGIATQVHHQSYDYATMAGDSVERLHPICRPCHKAASMIGERKATLAEANAYLGLHGCKSPSSSIQPTSPRTRARHSVGGDPVAELSDSGNVLERPPF